MDSRAQLCSSMTDAHISVKNITNGTEVVDRQNEDTVNKTIILDDIQDDSNTTDSSNTATHKHSQNNAVETKVLTVTVAVNITANNNSNNVVQDCVESKTVPASDASDNSNLQKETINDKNNENDKVLKYVYNNDKNDVSKTLKGHPKNSLKRRKRSDNSQNSDEDVKSHESKYAPLIVNYETSHNPNQLEMSPLGSTENIIKNANLVISPEPSHIEIELPIHERATGKVIKNANLADFNIETLHEKEAQPLKNNGNLKSDIEIIDVGKTKQLNKDSEEINDRYAHKDDRRPLNDSEESTERKEYNYTSLKSNPHDKPYSGSRESKELDESKEYSSGYRQSSRGSPAKKENTPYRGNSEKERTDFSRNYRQHRPLKSEFKNERKSYKESEESTDKTYPKYSPTRNQENFESNEKGNIRGDKKIDSNESQESYESKENHFPINNQLAQRKLDSSRSKVVDNDESNSKSKESSEADSIESSKYSKPQDYSDESKEKYDEHDKPYRQNYSGKFKTENKAFDGTPEYLQQNSESSNEKIDSSRENYKNEIKNQTTPLKIQDVDLGDFSYERIEVNDKGQVVPAKDSSEENISTSKSETLKNKNNENISSSVEDLNSYLSAESKEDNKSLIKINAGEIKPVVEINADTNSDEFISKEPINANLQIKDTSLEAFLGVKDSQENDQNEKIKIQSEENKGDVKQQFERIPLNYKHDENKNKRNHEELQPLTTEKSSNINTQVEVSEGTIEIVPTDEPKHDENLKFKFDDVPVSLPEIKLPEDILAYTYEEPHYEKQKNEDNKKRKYYPYESFVKDDDEKNKKPDNDDRGDYDDDGYDSYYGNYKQIDNYKKKNADEEEKVEEEEEDHADLYEKFVRERFGKQGTFAQRSEKLQNPTPVRRSAFV